MAQKIATQVMMTELESTDGEEELGGEKDHMENSPDIDDIWDLFSDDSYVD